MAQQAVVSDPTNPDDKEWRKLRRSVRPRSRRKAWKERCRSCGKLFETIWHLELYCPECK